MEENLKSILRLRLKNDKVTYKKFKEDVQRTLRRLGDYCNERVVPDIESLIKSNFAGEPMTDYLIARCEGKNPTDIKELHENCILSKGAFNNQKKGQTGSYNNTDDCIALYFGYAGYEGQKREKSIQNAFRISDKSQNIYFKDCQIEPDYEVLEKNYEVSELDPGHFGKYIIYGLDEFSTKAEQRYYVSFMVLNGTNPGEIEYYHTQTDFPHKVSPDDIIPFYSKQNRILSLYIEEKNQAKSNIVVQICFVDEPNGLLIVPYICNTDTNKQYRQIAGTAFFEKLPEDFELSNKLISRTLGRDLKEEKFIKKGSIFKGIDFKKAVNTIYSVPFSNPILYPKR